MVNEIILFEEQDVKLEVNIKDETVWLTQAQISKLFNRDIKTISKHIINVFEEELDEKSNSQKTRIANSDKPVNIYNLDVIISVGYRVKSKNGILFRKWANKVLKDYLIKGYAVNNRRLEYLEKTVKLIDIANRVDDNLNDGEAREIIRVISDYSMALNLLDNYDNKKFSRPNGKCTNKKITYEECKEIINKLKYNTKSNLFALEREEGLKSIIGALYQTYDGKDVYFSIEEKAANLLYLITKNHVFIDGNKRVAATLFIYFLNFYNILYYNGKKVIDNNTLVSLTLLIAESNPKEKDILIDLIMNFICVN